MDYTLDTLKKLLAIDSPTGMTGEAAAFVAGELTTLGFAPVRTQKGCVLCCLGGELPAAQEGHARKAVPARGALLLSAHIDTLGGMVAEIKSNGRLRLTKLGGLQPHNIEGENCVVRTRLGKTLTGTMQLNVPSVHVNDKYAEQKRDFDGMEVVLDAPVRSKEETGALGVAVGDFVCFDPRTTITDTDYIKSRFLDDKLSAAILLGLVREIAKGELVPARRTYAYFTVYEEVGHGCASGVPADVTEILCVDMGCVGEGLTCDERQVSICVKDSAGPYDYDMTTALIRLAAAQGIGYATDVYPHYGSDADAALAAGYDVRHALIGAGVYASHGYERSHVDGVRNTAALLRAYLTQP